MCVSQLFQTFAPDLAANTSVFNPLCVRAWHQYVPTVAASWGSNASWTMPADEIDSPSILQAMRNLSSLVAPLTRCAIIRPAATLAAASFAALCVFCTRLDVMLG